MKRAIISLFILIIAIAMVAVSRDSSYYPLVYDQTQSDARFVNVAGDTMTGALILSESPQSSMEAATKDYVDTQITANTVYENYLPLAGGTMSGTLVLNGDPASSMEAATKQYVDARPDATVLFVAAVDSLAKNKQSADYVCDGVNDDEQIQAAIIEVYSGGGGVVVLSEGTFTLGNSITLYDEVTISGQGAATTITGPIIEYPEMSIFINDSVQGLTGIELKNFKIDMTGATGLLSGISFDGVNMCRLDRLTIEAVPFYSIFITDSTNVQIDYNFIENGIDSPIILQNSKHNYIGNNLIYNHSASSAHGILLFSGSDQNKIYSNQITNMGDEGILVWGSNDNIISGNYLGENGDQGIEITGEGAYGNAYRNLVIANVIYANHTIGVNIYSNAYFNVVSGNSIWGNDQDGIALGKIAEYLANANLIENNTIYGNNQQLGGTGNGSNVHLIIGANRNIIQGNSLRQGTATYKSLYGVLCDSGTLNNQILNNGLHTAGSIAPYLDNGSNIFTGYKDYDSDTNYYIENVTVASKIQTTGDARYLQLTGGTLSGELKMGASSIRTSDVVYAGGVQLASDPASSVRAISQGYGDRRYLQLSGGTMTGELNMGANSIRTSGTIYSGGVSLSADPASSVMSCRKGYNDRTYAPLAANMYRLYVDTTATTATGSGNQPLKSFTIPGGLLSTGNVIIKVYLEVRRTTGSGTCSLLATYGGASLTSSYASANTQPIYLTLDLWNNGATNSQSAIQSSDVVAHRNFGTSAVDSTQDQTLAFLINLGTTTDVWVIDVIWGEVIK